MATKPKRTSGTEPRKFSGTPPTLRVEQPAPPVYPGPARVAATQRAEQLLRGIEAILARLREPMTSDSDLAREIAEANRLYFAAMGRDAETVGIYEVLFALEAAALTGRNARFARNMIKASSPDIAERFDLQMADAVIAKWHSTKARANESAKWTAVRSLLQKAGLRPPKADTLRKYCKDMRKPLKERGFYESVDSCSPQKD